MTLVDRHIEFLEALRAAGIPVSLTEGLDAVAALSVLGRADDENGVLSWGERAMFRDAYAATVVKKRSQRPTFEQLFELYFPAMLGDGTASRIAEEGVSKDNAEALERFRDDLAEALFDNDMERLRALAAEAVARFGSMPGRGPGMSSWSSYTTMRRLGTEELVAKLIQGLRRDGWTEEEAERVASKRTASYGAMVEADARRRIAEEKGPAQIATVAVKPTIERLDFLTARRADLDLMRREIYPLARRLANRLAREQHQRRRGPLDIRRTMRSSLDTGGVPIVTHHKPKRPHRTELVVLCDVSGSVSNFASFTLLLVFALREVFGKVRAFTFVDQIHEVTEYFTPGADMVDVMTELTKATEFASRFGRTNYGRALRLFADEHADALSPKSSLLILGDARNNYSDLALDALADVRKRVKNAWWLNPEARRHWDTGDSDASKYGAIVPMTECRNLTQLSDFVADIA